MRSPSFIRDVNRTAVLRLIGRDGPIARHEIARQLGISPATVTDVTRGLLEAGLVRAVDRAPSRGGRPAVLLGLVPAAANALGVKIAADHVVGVRVDLDGVVLERFEERFDAAASDAIAQLLAVVRPHVPPPDDDRSPLFLGVGLGVPGVVDGRAFGRVDSPMLGWRGLAIGDLLQRELDVPVLVDNDVNTLAVAERLYGRGRSVEHFLTVTIGRGVGLGIVLRGEVFRGANGGAGEFGHVTVAEDGPVCECGKRGCLETLVSDPALVRQARQERILDESAGIGELQSLANDGGERALTIYARAGATLGRAVAGLVNVLSPELVLVSGEGTQAWPHLAPSFERELRAAVFPPLRSVGVEVEPWDDEKWALGAAALVLRATFIAAPFEEEHDRRVRARLAPGRVRAGSAR